MMAFTPISLVAVLLLSPTGDEARPQGRGTAPPQACSLLSAADLAKLTGRKNLATTKVIAGRGDEPGATGCGYIGTTIHVDVQPLQSIASYNTAAERLVKSGEFQPLTGLGDAAWFRTNKIGKQYGVVVRVGTILVMVSMDMSESGPPDQARPLLTRLAEHASRGVPR